MLSSVDSEALGFVIAGFRRFFFDVTRLIRPCFFRASPFLFEHLNRRRNDRTFVAILFTTCTTGVVINKQTAHVVIDALILFDEVFIRTGNGIGGATIDLPLIFDCRHIGAQIDFFGQLRRAISRRSKRCELKFGLGVLIPADVELAPVGAFDDKSLVGMLLRLARFSSCHISTPFFCYGQKNRAELYTKKRVIAMSLSDL